MMSRSTRTAFTLVETLVASTLALAVLTALWSVVGAGETARAAGGAKVEAVHAALQFEARLRDDLSRLYVDGSHGVTSDATPGSTLSFHVGEPRGSALQYGLVNVHAVTWRFDPEAGALWRQVDDERPERLNGDYETVTFALSTPVGSPPSLTYLVTSLSSTGAARPAATRRPSDRSVLCGSAPLRELEIHARHPYWNCLVRAAKETTP